MTREQQMASNAAVRITKINGLQLHPVERGLFDVFDGDGFTHHSRYRHYKGKWFHVSGKSVNVARLPVIQ